MAMFKPENHHELICIFENPPSKMKMEKDKTLYFDTEKSEFFVVESKEYVSGPSVTCHHSCNPITEAEAKEIVSQDKEWQKAAEPFLSAE